MGHHLCEDFGLNVCAIRFFTFWWVYTIGYILNAWFWWLLAFWYLSCLLVCRVLSVPLYHSSYVELEGHVKLFFGVLAYVDCLIVRCFANLFITRMLCTSYDQDAMHFIWSCLLTTLIRFAYLVDFCIYYLSTVMSEDTTLCASVPSSSISRKKRRKKFKRISLMTS